MTAISEQPTILKSRFTKYFPEEIERYNRIKTTPFNGKKTVVKFPDYKGRKINGRFIWFLTTNDVFFVVTSRISKMNILKIDKHGRFVY